mmetsp:Transcript_1126/g.1728  ORF Transcript_1126/g.1728 Transcript_1126/m.1728 type:complete len:717 (+) Transcript_1126:291-2441(+)
MGCACSTYIDQVKEDDIVGGVGRTAQQINVKEVPEERDAMVALEVAASRHTIYRKRMRNFKPDLELDYNKSVTLLHLRNLLDEPVGRFYLKEFAREKDLPEMTALVDAWVNIHCLKTHKELSLKTVLKQASIEDGTADLKDKEKDQVRTSLLTGMSVESIKANMDFRRNNAEDMSQASIAHEPSDSKGDIHDSEQASSERSSTDVYRETTLQYGYPVEYPSNDEIIEMAKKIISTSLEKDSASYLGKYIDPAKIASTKQIAEKAIEENNVEELRHHAFLPLQNAVFIRIVEAKFSIKFREHSEYKRYKNKFQKCYNTVSHRDLDFMSTLGKGSFGRVIRVRKKTTGAMFALKVMSKKKILSGAESAEQVTIERNVLVTCECSSIVRVEFAFQTSRALFLGLELLGGGNLVDAMHHNGGVLNDAQAVFIIAQMVLGLEHLHKHGILYRDLKPVNVMLDSEGNAVLTDLGLAAKFRDSEFPKEQGAISSNGNRLTRRRSMQKLKQEELKCVGTFGYRAPEVLAVAETKAGYSVEVDYWALGVCLFYVLHDRLPFNRKAFRKSAFAANVNLKDQERRYQKEPLLLPKDMDPRTRSFVVGCLELEPSKRLGHNVEDVKSHPFFASIDWKLLAERRLKPVYKPKTTRREQSETPMYDGLQEAMQQFTQDNVLELFGGENEMNDEYMHVGRNQQRLFREWEYVPDQLLVPDWEIAGESRLFD